MYTARRGVSEWLLFGPSRGRRQAIAALGAGVHVLTEKPLCATLEEGEAMATAARNSPATLAVGYTLHYHPALLRARQMVDSPSPTPPELAVGCALKLRVRLHKVTEGLLGTLCHVHWHIGSLRTLMNSKSSYQATLEGALILDYAHQPDNILWMTSDTPTTVSVGLSPKPDCHIETNARVSISKRHTCVHGDQCHI